MKFIIVCTGTAGHINPGIVIAQELLDKRPGSEIIFIGSGRGMEKKLIPEAGFKLINIKMTGIKRGIKPHDIVHNIKTVSYLLSARRKAAAIIKSEKPDAVIGTGGYICYPVLKAAAKRKIPTFVHESNALPGMTVRMLSSVADKVMITYPGFEKHYKRPERIVITGTPVRKSPGLGEISSEKINETDKPLVVSFWGSLGAERMNEMVAGFIQRNLAEKAFYHIHAAGNSKDRLLKALSGLGITETAPPLTEIRDYIDDMPQLMSRAELVLCRAGGITLAELTNSGKPAIIIPSAFVPDNVQEINAQQLEKCGAAIIIKEAECSGGMLFETVNGLINDKARLGEMSKAAKSLAAPDAASDIADLILEFCKKDSSLRSE